MLIEDNKKYEIKQAPATKKQQPTVSVPETVAETIDNKTSSQAHSSMFRASLNMRDRIKHLLSLKSKDEILENLKNSGFTSTQIDDVKNRDIESLNKLDELFSIKAYTSDNKLKPVITSLYRDYFIKPERDLDSALELAKMTYKDEKGTIKARFTSYEITEMLKEGIDTKSQTFKTLASIMRNDANLLNTSKKYGDACDSLDIYNENYFSEHSKIRHTAPRFNHNGIKEIMDSKIDVSSERFKQFIDTTTDINGEQRPFFTASDISDFFHSNANIENIKTLQSITLYTDDGKQYQMFFLPKNIEKFAKLKNFDTFIKLANMRDTTKPNSPSIFNENCLAEFIDKGYNLQAIIEMAKDENFCKNQELQGLSKSTIIRYGFEKFNTSEKELKQALDLIDDEKLKTMLENFYNKMPYKNIDDTWRYVDAYNNLNGNYTTIVNYNGYNDFQKYDKPNYREYWKYCKEKGIPIKDNRYGDFVQNQYIGQLVDLCKNNKSEITEFLYDEYYIKTKVPSHSTQDLLREINQKYGVKVFLPANQSESNEYLKQVREELEAWYKASSGKAIMPPTIDLQTAKQDYIDYTSAYGSSRATGYCDSSNTKAISLDGHLSMKVLRHEMTHSNDEKRLFGFPKNLKGESKIWNEFRKGGIPEWHINYAFNNPKEFIAVAMEGDLQKYSEEFIKQLHEFGLPKWATKIAKLAR